MIELKDVLKSLNLEKNKELFNETNQNEFQPYLINRFYSFFPETLLIANQMNYKMSLPRDMQYRYLLQTIPKKSRYTAWIKNTYSSDLLLIKEYYGCSIKKAKNISKLITEENLLDIKTYLDKGGINKINK